MYFFEAIEPKKPTDTLTSNFNLVVGVSLLECLEILCIQARTVVFNSYRSFVGDLRFSTATTMRPLLPTWPLYLCRVDWMLLLTASKRGRSASPVLLGLGKRSTRL